MLKFMAPSPFRLMKLTQGLISFYQIKTMDTINASWLCKIDRGVVIVGFVAVFVSKKKKRKKNITIMKCKSNINGLVDN